MTTPTEEWFQTLNRKFREQDTDVRQRPFLALDSYCKDFNVKALAMNSAPAKAIFDWFYSNTKPEAHHIGSLFTGVYYYDTCFWPLDVFITYGSVTMDALASLQSMSASMKEAVMSVPNDAWSYIYTWANSVDYAYGFDDMEKMLPAEAVYARSLLANADRELRAAIAQLLEHRPNAKASMSCRMATEIFLKVFLVLKAGKSETQIKAFSHSLDKLIDEIRKLDQEHDLLSIEGELSVFPAISDRYTGDELTLPSLWRTYLVSLHVAAAVIRSFTDRDIRSSVLAQQNAS